LYQDFKYYFMNRIFTNLSILTFLMAGCLTTPEPEVPIRVELIYQVHQLGNTFEREDDSIRINEFKFAIDRFNLIAEDSLVLGSSNRIDSMIFFYNEDLTNHNLVLSVDLGYQDIDLFEGYEMFLRPVGRMDNISDRDFIGSSETYSVIAKGFYNGEEFSFKSRFSFDRYVDFGIVEVGQDKETLVIEKSLAISDLFINEIDQIIDPTDSDNIALINELFKENLKIEGYSLTRFVDLDE